jgi:inosose dehydratase
VTFLDRVAGAPISWGVCEAPGWGMQLSVDRVLREARDLGLRAFEQGSLGWLPDDPAELRAKLDEYDMTLVAGFVPLVLHDPDETSAMLEHGEQVAANLAAAGGRCYNTAVVGSLSDWGRPAIDDAAWAELFANLGRMDEICAAHGLVQTVHPHVDTLIELDVELRRFLDSCDSKLCLDTGHTTIGGSDPVQIVADHFDRIGLVHLKDVDADAAARERSGELDLMQATQAGLFPSLGDGIVRIGEVVELLESKGYDGWYVMETDVALTDGEPPPGEGPVQGVERSLDFLRNLERSAV